MLLIPSDIVLSLNNGSKKITILLFILIISFSSILMLKAPSLAINGIVFLLATIFVYFLRIGMLQIIYLTTLFPMLLPGVSQDFNNVLISLITLGSVFSIVVSCAIADGKLDHNGKLDIIIFLYVLLGVLSCLSSYYNSSFDMFNSLELMRFISYGLLIAVCFHFTRDIKTIRNLFILATLASIYIAIYSYAIVFNAGVIKFISLGGIYLHSYGIGQSNANTIAMAIANSMPVLIAYILLCKNESRKYTTIAILILLFFVWLAWNSRGSYLFVFFAIITIILFHKNKWKFISVLLSVATVALVLVVTNIFPLIAVYLRLEKGLTGRGDLWTAAIRMFCESPILGKGPGYYSPHKYNYMDPGLGRMIAGKLENITPHNLILARAVDMGIFAVMVQLAIWVIPIVYFIKNAKIVRDCEYYYLYIACGAIWVGIIFRSIVDTGANIIGILALVAIYKIPELAIKDKNQNNINCSVKLPF
jgi:O-antigen ligase